MKHIVHRVGVCPLDCVWFVAQTEKTRLPLKFVGAESPGLADLDKDSLVECKPSIAIMGKRLRLRAEKQFGFQGTK